MIGPNLFSRRAKGMRQNIVIWGLLSIGILCSPKAAALTFNLPEKGNIIGHVKSAVVREGDTLSTIGRRYDIGGYEMKEANPGVPYLYPKPGSRVTIPSQFILPSGPREGLVINLAELRLYFFHSDGQRVSTYPIGVGQQGWLTPLGTSTIVRKRENPWWIVPESILENHRRKGKPIKAKWPPGPKNPLGEFAMNTGFKNIVIHGTPYPMGVGLRSSHGCIRMLPEDIRQLYPNVSVGASVRIVHEPHKVGLAGNELFLESHEALSEEVYRKATPSIQSSLKKLANKMGLSAFDVHWDNTNRIQKEASGYPNRIGVIRN